MDNNLIGQAMFIVFSEFGVIFDKIDNTDAGVIMRFTVPKSSYCKDAHDFEMSGKHLASVVKHKLEDMKIIFSDIRYHIREEDWTREKANIARRNAYKELGYKNWQI